jgi:hypothetical protein
MAGNTTFLALRSSQFEMPTSPRVKTGSAVQPWICSDSFRSCTVRPRNTRGVANPALLRGTFCLNDFLRIAKNERIHPAASDWNLKLTRAVILDFFSRNWCAPFGVLFDSVKDLLFTILFKISMLPSLSQWIQPMLECRFHTTSWAFHSNALANELIDIGILCRDSAISRTEAICQHYNSIF